MLAVHSMIFDCFVIFFFFKPVLNTMAIEAEKFKIDSEIYSCYINSFFKLLLNISSRGEGLLLEGGGGGGGGYLLKAYGLANRTGSPQGLARGRERNYL